MSCDGLEVEAEDIGLVGRYREMSCDGFEVGQEDVM